MYGVGVEGSTSSARFCNEGAVKAGIASRRHFPTLLPPWQSGYFTCTAADPGPVDQQMFFFLISSLLLLPFFHFYFPSGHFTCTAADPGPVDQQMFFLISSLLLTYLLFFHSHCFLI